MRTGITRVGHAAGPWRATPIGTTFSIDAQGYSGVAFINPLGMHDKGIPDKRDKANARLIAAAPELLEALKRAFNLIKESGFTSGLTEDEFDATLKQAGEAIAKAERSTNLICTCEPVRQVAQNILGAVPVGTFAWGCPIHDPAIAKAEGMEG